MESDPQSMKIADVILEQFTLSVVEGGNYISDAQTFKLGILSPIPLLSFIMFHGNIKNAPILRQIKVD